MSKTFDRYSSIIFLVLGIGIIVESTKISTSSYGSNVGPDVFPKVLGALLIILSCRLFYETFKYVNKGKNKESLDYKRFLVILVSAILYALLLETLGYVITTFLFLTISFQVMQKGGWLKTLLISGAFSYGIYFLFVEVLEGTLPGFPTWFS
ncbi:tripartite tricarboxylate transporter TctB family protein [Schinkia azotoformans]|uniref:Transport protein n=1 Tax=Schinkia azotoformans LMG 9581 TaxID=1131731 RepID=K6DHW2_SCHAZ|nr:tripartite tricarboxylate transporter TctB family protein [Schinkia azotoformans]EKN67894.1 transport protein [Schinkia azotoformans LMG 9581]MEC1637086.1 tripartite tricarboxylate transporter TctB family protein [Schinkia azotoformans]MEC1719888.1 tripartite tricarboxylate transporter TctB family protein [Schinkia azotoformans]MEC1945469.1 tripartite tricarboxylate transporter TctB family protein [Schinkia azotoformans]MED4351313.1 tripartite tricarboxylate transporter TctB family protein 